jgi:hypothetical protein
MTEHAITVETTRGAKNKRRKTATCSCGWTVTTKTTAGLNKVIAAQHPQVFCPTPDKRRHASREAAAAALLEFWQTAGTGKKELRRAYECECGCWHTTSRPGQDVVPSRHFQVG